MPDSLPEGWRRVPLGNLGRFINGRAFKPTDWGESGLPIVRIQNLTNAETVFNYYDGDVSPDNLIESGDIVVSWSASIEARTWTRGPAILNQHIFKVVPDGEVADQRFLYFLLEATTRELRRRVHGTTMQHVTKGTFDSTQVLLPPLPEQRAIAAVLDAVDDTIERTEAVIAATEELRRALLHELLTRGVPGWHSEWRHVPGLGIVPACWEVTTLGEAIAELRYGTSAKLTAAGGLPVLRIPNVARGTIDLTELKFAHLPDKEAAAVELRAGDLLIVRTNGNPNICGASAVWEEANGRWLFASYLLRLRPLPERLDSTYAWMYLRSAGGRRQLAGNIRTSAGNYNLSAEGLRGLPLPLPPVREQRAMGDALRDLHNAQQAEQEALNRIKALKAALSSALLSGSL